MTTTSTGYRLTQYASGGGCACKIPPGELEPITLTKPLGVGVLNNRHKSTGEVFAHAVANRRAATGHAVSCRRSPVGIRARRTALGCR